MINVHMLFMVWLIYLPLFIERQAQNDTKCAKKKLTHLKILSDRSGRVISWGIVSPGLDQIILN